MTVQDSGKDRLDVLLLEDDEVYAEEVCSFFSSHGISSEHVLTFEDALSRVKTHSPRVMVMDQFIGSMDILSVFSTIRTNFAGALMILTGNADQMDRVVGIELGADDYVSKLVSPREIVARVRSLIRAGERKPSAPAARTAAAGESGSAGRWKLDIGRRELFSPAGELVHLTSTEFGILKYLSDRKGQTISRAELSLEILHRKYDALDRSVDNLVSRIRKKFDEIEPGCSILRSIRAEGYIFIGFGPESGGNGNS